MTEDSAASSDINVFDFGKEGKELSPPTTSKGPIVASAVENSVTIGAEAPECEPIPKSSVTFNGSQNDAYVNTSTTYEEGAKREPDDKDSCEKKVTGPNDRSKTTNGTTSDRDSVDTKCVPSYYYNTEEGKKNAGCVVDCLYYTIQCCECTII